MEAKALMKLFILTALVTTISAVTCPAGFYYSSGCKQCPGGTPPAI